MHDDGRNSLIRRLFGIHERQRRISRLRRLWASPPPEMGVPVRATPRSIKLQEGYGYTITLREHAQLSPDDKVDTWGLLTVDLPFDGRDFLTYEARRDVDAAQQRHATSALQGHIGFLGLSDPKGTLRTALAERRSLAPGYAWPLVVPLLDEQTVEIDERVEKGMTWTERVVYRPKAPRPSPVMLTMQMSRDVAVPLGPPRGDQAVPAPAVGREGHVAFIGELSLQLPAAKQAGAKEPKASMPWLALKWPTPSHSGRFHLEAIGAPQASHLRFDSKMQQIRISNVSIPLTREGPYWVGHFRFKLIALDGIDLQGQSRLGGDLVLRIDHLTLSEARLQLFDATGQVAPDQSVISYETNLNVTLDFILTPDDAQPHLIARRWVWPISALGGSVDEEIELALDEQDFEFARRPLTAERVAEQLWIASRNVAGRPLRLDLAVRLWEPTAARMPYPLPPEAPPVEGRARYIAVEVHAAYDGPWSHAVAQLRQLEESLAERLRLRNMVV